MDAQKDGVALSGSQGGGVRTQLGLLSWARVCSEGQMWVCIAAGNENGINAQSVWRGGKGI